MFNKKSLKNKRGSRMLGNPSGFSLLQVILVIGISGFVWVGLANVLDLVHNNQRHIMAKSTVVSVRQSLINAVSNEASWQHMVATQSFLECTSDADPYCNGDSTSVREIIIFDNQGNEIFDSTLDVNGFTVNGTLCNTFNQVDGNDACPIGVKVLWRALCSNELCDSQQDFISIEFRYLAQNPRRTIPFNAVNYNVVEQPRNSLGGHETPLLACAGQGKVFIGEGQSFNGTDADAQGCVPYETLVGPRGFQGGPGRVGPQGPRGPQGPTGPQGPQGPSASC